MLFPRYKADFLCFFPENAANYVSILMYELQRKAPSERRKSHFRGPRFQIFPGRIPPDPPTSPKFSASVNKTTGSAPACSLLYTVRWVTTV
jgi:hypothetical protein